MLISFTKLSEYGVEQSLAEHSRQFQQVIDYFEKPEVWKVVDGNRQKIIRNPAPEVLMGSGAMVRQQLMQLRYKRPYHSAFMAFAPDEFDCDAFNAGDEMARWQISKCLTLLQEVIWPGIPRTARPTFYATTHTHTGKMEVNFLVPGYILNHAGKLRSYNPNPPPQWAKISNLWDAARDLMNLNFNWFDPLDPSRQQLFVMPDWKTKADAEARRNGNVPEEDKREKYAKILWRQIEHGVLQTRRDILETLSLMIEQDGMVILKRTADSITIGRPDAAPQERMRLKGAIFRADFDGALFFSPDRIARAQADRANTQWRARKRFAAAWEMRARYNLERFGKGVWPASPWSADLWLSPGFRGNVTRIPRRNYAYVNQISQGEHENDTDRTADTRFSGKTSDRSRNPDQQHGRQGLRHGDRPSAIADGAGQADTAFERIARASVVLANQIAAKLKLDRIVNLITASVNAIQAMITVADLGQAAQSVARDVSTLSQHIQDFKNDTKRYTTRFQQHGRNQADAAGYRADDARIVGGSASHDREAHRQAGGTDGLVETNHRAAAPDTGPAKVDPRNHVSTTAGSRAAIEGSNRTDRKAGQAKRNPNELGTADGTSYPTASGNPVNLEATLGDLLRLARSLAGGLQRKNVKHTVTRSIDGLIVDVSIFAIEMTATSLRLLRFDENKRDGVFKIAQFMSQKLGWHFVAQSDTMNDGDILASCHEPRVGHHIAQTNDMPDADDDQPDFGP
jgi:hypothetical protein